MEITNENIDSPKEIDVEKIMEEIKAEIKRKGYTNDMLSFSDVSVFQTDVFNDDVFSDALDSVSRKWNVSYYKPLVGNPLKIFVTKVIRKIIKPLMFPLVTEQTEFNASVAQFINQLCLYLEKERREKEFLLKRIDELEKRSKNA